MLYDMMHAFELVRSIIVKNNSYDDMHPYNSSFIVGVVLSNDDYFRFFRMQPKGPEQCWRGTCLTGSVFGHSKAAMLTTVQLYYVLHFYK